MSNHRLPLLAAVSLVVGGLLGVAGSFSPSTVRGIAWGLDGTALVMGALLLAVHHIKLANEQLAAGFSHLSQVKFWWFQVPPWIWRQARLPLAQE